MPIWIQLTKPKHLDTGGQGRQYHPGDWVRVGRQTALEWLADGSAVDPFGKLNKVAEKPGTVGIVGFGQGASPQIASVPVSRIGSFEFCWEKTLFLDLSAPVNVALIPVGFQLLSTWQMCVPLASSGSCSEPALRLAVDEGTEEERELTRSVIRDLRVPVYDTRCIFARRCDETIRLLELYCEGGQTRLAFLRALYTVKPLILALPVTWTGQAAPME